MSDGVFIDLYFSICLQESLQIASMNGAKDS